MTKPISTTPTTPYPLRVRNEPEVSKKKKTHHFKPGRKELDISETPSITAEKSHSCTVIEPNNTKIKVYARYTFSLQRFMISHAWNCNTTRGKTFLNGSVCHCNGLCQSGHAALSPALYDDKLKLIIEKINEVGIDKLSTIEQNYLTSRFELSNVKDHEELNEVLKKLPKNEWEGSIIHSSIGNVRNATYDNPTSSNKIDSQVETRLRPLEDALSEECKNDKLAPKEAMSKLHDEYQVILKEMEKNLIDDLTHLQELFDALEKLIISQQAIEKLTPAERDAFYVDHWKLMGLYQIAFDKRFVNAIGVPKYENLKHHLNCHQSPFVLKTFIKNKNLDYFNSNLIHLKIVEDRDTLLKKAKNETKLRLDEVRIQLEIVSRPFDEINELMKFYYGVPTPTKKHFTTPNKENIATQLNTNVLNRLRKKLDFEA